MTDTHTHTHTHTQKNDKHNFVSRCHIVGQFNRGLYEVIVASDEKFLEETHPELGNDIKSGKAKKVDKDKERSKRDKDKESGVARGIDFQFVSNIINFDFPHDTDSYVHRYSICFSIFPKIECYATPLDYFLNVLPVSLFASTSLQGWQ